MKALQVLEKTPVALDVPSVSTELGPHRPEGLTVRGGSDNTKKWVIRITAAVLITAAGLSILWYTQRATQVTLTQPKQTSITETIASSGSVGGVTETNAGSQTQGIVEALYVDEGSTVVRGQQLSLIKNNVADAQIVQAQGAVSTAQTQLEQVSRGALASDIDASMQQVRQTQAVAEQQNALIAQAQQNVLQARSLLAQVEAERDLAKTELGRSTSLVNSGVISRSEFDQAKTTYLVAVKKVAAQNQAISLAQAGTRSAQAGLKSAQANVKTQQARLKTIQLGARPEDVLVAQRRISEAENALSVAQQQAANAIVVAPFAGTVTKINAQVGQTVGSTGVLTLVSSQLEIRLEVDESNLSSLKVGQEAVISSAAFGDSTFRGSVSELGAAVDQTRGTIEIKVVPIEAPEWLRPGQTVDVNIITAENVSRLLIPQTAVMRAGDENVVFIVIDGKAVQRTVVTRPATKRRGSSDLGNWA